MSPALIRPTTSGVTLRSLSPLLGTEGAIPTSAEAVVVTGVTLDSRAVLAGDLYAALPGFRVHGATFAADAVRLGAAAVLTDPAGAALIDAGTRLAVPVVVVDRPRDVLGAVTAQVYGRPGDDLTLVGVTGTNGKTTTAYLVESALRAQGHRTGLVGTVETRIGDERVESVRTTPEATDLHAILGLMRERGIDACVMEVSSHALELHRVDGVVYDVALFTNLSQDHLDFHASMEDYFLAKAALFRPERSRRAVVCTDDAWGRRLAREAGVPVTTVSAIGPGPHAVDGVETVEGVESDWWVEQAAAAPGVADGPGEGPGLPFVLHGPESVSLRLVSHLPGTFNVANTALAGVCLLALGLTPAEVEGAMAVPPEVPGRMEVVSVGDADGPRCVVDFAHTPDAVAAALHALRPSTTGLLVAVLGAGGDRDSGKRHGMGEAAALHADIVVVTDDNPRSEDPAAIRDAVLAGARDAVESGRARATTIIDGHGRAEAIAAAVSAAIERSGPGAGVDTVVVLGKGHEKGQEINGVKHPFDDREALRSALSSAITHGSRA